MVEATAPSKTEEEKEDAPKATSSPDPVVPKPGQSVNIEKQMAAYYAK